MSKEIFLTEEIGYCYGVDDAIEIAVQAAKSSKGRQIYTYGYIIHNSDTISMLKNEYGIKIIEKADEVKDLNSVVIIRTHGAKKEEIEALKQKGVAVLDATCPFVIKTHRIVSKLQEEGYFVVVFGKSYHPEIVGILGQINQDNIVCVQHEEDIEKIGWKLKMACVFQSTVTFDDFSWAVVPLAKKCYELKVIKTICEVTITRQKYTKDIAKDVDVMIVIGGKNSSNTKKLVEMCQGLTKTFHVETKNELLSIDLNSFNKIGVTTGTSTPKMVVEDVIQYLRNNYGARLAQEIK